MDFDKSIIDEFVAEAGEHLQTVEDDLMTLEKGAGERKEELVNKVFRAVHTIKGSAGFLGLTKLAELAHSAETLLSMVRSGKVKPTHETVDVLLVSVDYIRAMLDDTEKSDEMDISSVLANLSAILENDGGAARTDHQPDTEQSAGGKDGALPGFSSGWPEISEFCKDNSHVYAVELNLTQLGDGGNEPMAVMKRLRQAGQVIEARTSPPTDDLREGLPKNPLITEILMASTLDAGELARHLGVAEENITPVEQTQKEIQPVATGNNTGTSPALKAGQTTEKPSASWDGVDRRKETIRLRLGILDNLMRLAGELVLVRNQQLLLMDKAGPAIKATAQRLDLVTTELQETVMGARMQPIGNLFNRFPRIVRDLGGKLDKKIDLNITGGEVELDNTILEALTDPLTHLVRNCCDHGIGTPAQRQTSGKPPTGRVNLTAYHANGQINIEITDDGKGIDPERVKRKALEKGLKTGEELEGMSQEEITSLILLPGFSTADKLSDISGRGVGMDVVKTSIEELGGTIEIESNVGKGSTVYMRLPLTLAIIPCLFVTAGGGRRYAIPQVNLEELVRLYGEEALTRVECAGAREVFRLRDRLLDLVRLEELLAHPKPLDEPARALTTEKYRKQRAVAYREILKAKHDHGPDVARRNIDDLNIAVLKVGGRRFGLIVERILMTEEIVVKPMSPSLKNLQCYAGATVMGDGKVALILDAQGIARHAGIPLSASAQQVDPVSTHTNGQETGKQTALLFTSGRDERFAIPLPMIKRVESISANQIEKTGDMEFATIDGVGVQALRLERVLNVTALDKKQELYLILPKNVAKPFGILASSLVDTVETSTKLDTESYMDKGLSGTAIIKGKMTLFLDIDALASEMNHGWAGAPGPDAPDMKNDTAQETEIEKQPSPAIAG